MINNKILNTLGSQKNRLLKSIFIGIIKLSRWLSLYFMVCEKISLVEQNFPWSSMKVLASKL